MQEYWASCAMCETHCKHRRKHCLQSNAGSIFSKSFKANGEVTPLGLILGVCLEALLDCFRSMLGGYWVVFGIEFGSLEKFCWAI